MQGDCAAVRMEAIKALPSIPRDSAKM